MSEIPDDVVEKALRAFHHGAFWREDMPAMRRAIAAAVLAEREACAKVADFYAEENMRLAGDTILHDPCLKGDFRPQSIEKHETLVIEGCSHSAMFHASQNIANAIRDRGKGDPT